MSDRLTRVSLGSGATRVDEPPDFLKSLLHCFYNDIYGPRPMVREPRNEDVWRYCGFGRLLSRWTLNRSITDFKLVAEHVFIEVIHEIAEWNLLSKLFRIDVTDILLIATTALSGPITTLKTASIPFMTVAW